MSRMWMTCRVCGAKHTNPTSFSICPACGAQERKERIARDREELERFNNTPFGQFMSLPEDERWRRVFEALEDKL